MSDKLIGCICFVGLALTLFNCIAGKLTGVVDWAWYWVLSPIWLPPVLVGIITIIENWLKKRRTRIMNNIGFISKKKIAKEIARLYKFHDSDEDMGVKDRYFDYGAQFALNGLCGRLKIKPLHRNKLGDGTGEMLYGKKENEQK